MIVFRYFCWTIRKQFFPPSPLWCFTIVHISYKCRILHLNFYCIHCFCLYCCVLLLLLMLALLRKIYFNWLWILFLLFFFSICVSLPPPPLLVLALIHFSIFKPSFYFIHFLFISIGVCLHLCKCFIKTLNESELEFYIRLFYIYSIQHQALYSGALNCCGKC